MRRLERALESVGLEVGQVVSVESHGRNGRRMGPLALLDDFLDREPGRIQVGDGKESAPTVAGGIVECSTSMAHWRWRRRLATSVIGVIISTESSRLGPQMCNGGVRPGSGPHTSYGFTNNGRYLGGYQRVDIPSSETGCSTGPTEDVVRGALGGAGCDSVRGSSLHPGRRPSRTR